MRKSVSIVFLLALTLLAAAEQKSLEQLKAEAEHADDNQPKLLAEVAERLVSVADKQFTDGESVKGHATVDEILQYAMRAHDTAIKRRKKMKEAEMHLRRCHRDLENMRRTLAAEDRPAVEAVEKKLEQYAEDVLEAMFAPPGKQK